MVSTFDTIGDSLLDTKLYAPQYAHPLVRRSRIEARFEEWRSRRLLVVEAPAGFGKTTVLAQWRQFLIEGGIPVAWLSIDRGDADPVRFFRYVTAALARLDLNPGSSATRLLGQGQHVAMDAVVHALANDMARESRPFALILDDFHLAGDKEIPALVDRLLHLAPQNFHLAIATRATPPLSLSRLRAHGTLAEVNAVDLRLSVDEADQFLNTQRTLGLSEEQVDALVSRTEGWVTGLQLAFLSLRDRADRGQFIRSFSGSNRAITDYLSDDVLATLTQEVQAFLLETSVLEQLNHSVCDAVTGRVNGHTLLKWLERENLFLIPLDDGRHWFRYHHLFADVLRQRLARDRPEIIPGLHRRAATWFEEADMPELAIGHWQAAGDMERAADLAERVAYPHLFDGRNDESVGAWLRMFDNTEILRQRPILAMCYAWMLTRGARFWDAQERLLEAESALFSENRGGLGKKEAEEVSGQLLQIRAAVQILHQGDMPEAVRSTEAALKKAAPADALSRAIAEFAMGLAYLLMGDPVPAANVMERARKESGRADTPFHTSGLTGYFHLLSNTYLGHTGKAMHAVEELLQHWEDQGRPPVPMMGLARMGLGQIHLNRLEIGAAEPHIVDGLALVDLGYEKLGYVFGHLLHAEFLRVTGRAERAIQEIENVVQHAADNEMSALSRLARAVLARHWISGGYTAKAAAWARERDISVPEKPDLAQEAEGLALAQLQLRTGRPERALMLLRRLEGAAEKASRQTSLVDILVLQALCLDAQGRRDDAVATIRRALETGEAAGTALPFLHGGAGALELVALVGRQNRLTDTPVAPDLVRRIREIQNAAALVASQPRPSRSTGAAQAPDENSGFPFEALSHREIEVPALMAEGFSNPEIADRLFVAKSTVKKHINHIYAKLDVRNRTRAIARAREYALL